MSTSKSKELLWQLKKAPGNAAVFLLLEHLANIPLTHPVFIKEYHEQLLFLKAFAANKKILNAALAGLERISAATKQAGPFVYAGLCGDGLPNTELICSYSLTLMDWLATQFPRSVNLHSSAADAETVRKIAQLLCPYVEFEKTTQGELNLVQRITAITGVKNSRAQLSWLMDTFATCSLPLQVKEELFRQLKVYVQWKMDEPACSRSFLHFNIGEIFFQKTYLKKVNSQQAIAQKINAPQKLTALQKQVLCDTIKTSLAFLCRETDPVTYADEETVQLFDTGRGFSIALLYMQKEKRLSLESYVGYMAFKNGVPVSYGGGWIFGSRCKIGVNIYPAFRRGESAWMFCQVLRLYHQYFSVAGFDVSPYQFGKGNAEGLKSGAFWFYYRLGFRPANVDICSLAASEWQKITSDKKYRTPKNVLKKFTVCPVSLTVPGRLVPDHTAAELSAAVSRYINQYFNCNRTTAVIAGFKKLKNEFRIQTRNETLALLCLLINEKTTFTEREKKEIQKVFGLQAKSNERDFILGIQKCTAYWKLVRGIDVS